MSEPLKSNSTYMTNAKRAINSAKIKVNMTPEECAKGLRFNRANVADVYDVILDHEFTGLAGLVKALAKRRNLGHYNESTLTQEVGYVCRAFLESGMVHVKTVKNENNRPLLQYKRAKGVMLVPEEYPIARGGNTKSTNGKYKSSLAEASPHKPLQAVQRQVKVAQDVVDRKIQTMMSALTALQDETSSAFEEIGQAVEEAMDKSSSSGELESKLQEMQKQISSIISH